MHRILRYVVWALVLLGTLQGTAARAQTDAGHPGRPFSVGFLGVIAPSPNDDGKIVGELARLGYVEGRNLHFEISHAGGDPARLLAAAHELVRRKVDVIFAVTNASAFAAKAATSTIPVVVWAAHGAEETGLVSNLRRPGGNITGTESLAIELDAKRLELIRTIVPGLSSMGIVFDGTDQGTTHHIKNIRTAGSRLKMTFDSFELRQPGDFERVLLNGPTVLRGGILLMTSPLTFVLHPRLSELALSRGLPMVCEFRAQVQAGCLLSYGPTLDEITQRNAVQIDKILRGTPPGELPFERPTRFELVINLKTAKALGLKIPEELLVRADAVIQ